jgi:hypothetical protein
MKQRTLAMTTGFERYTKKTRRALFLEEMEQVELSRLHHFEVRRADGAVGHWETAAMAVDMRGKALLFTIIDVQQTEAHSDFQGVPDLPTYAQEAAILNRTTVLAEKRYKAQTPREFQPIATDCDRLFPQQSIAPHSPMI